MLTRQVLQFLGFSESLVSRTLIHFNQQSNGPLIRAETGIHPLNLANQFNQNPFNESGVQTPTTNDLRQLLRMIWEREEIILVELSNGTLQSAQHRIMYPLRLSFAPSLSIRYSTAFQTEVSLLDMQKLDKYLRDNRPQLSFLPLPEQDLIYTSGGLSSHTSHRSQIDLRFVSRSREQIEQYLLFAFNDPAYYCPALFDLVLKFHALALLRTLQSLFDGKMAMRQNGRILLLQAQEGKLQVQKHTVTSYSYRGKGEKKLRVTEIEINRRDLYNRLGDPRTPVAQRNHSQLMLGRYYSEVLAAGTGEIADSMDGEESKVGEESKEMELPQIWWNNQLETDFIKFLGFRYRASLENSEVKLTRDRQFQILFTLKIERYETKNEDIKNSWTIYRSNKEFLELNKLLEKRFEQEYQELFERESDYISELKVHWVEASDSISAKQLLSRYLEDIVQLNGLFNCLGVRRFFALEEGIPRLEQEGRSQTLDDYFDMQSVGTSELESHHESLLHSPEQAIITPDYFH